LTGGDSSKTGGNLVLIRSILFGICKRFFPSRWLLWLDLPSFYFASNLGSVTINICLTGGDFVPIRSLFFGVCERFFFVLGSFLSLDTPVFFLTVIWPLAASPLVEFSLFPVSYSQVIAFLQIAVSSGCG
jgi:hypothetical protein